MKKLILLGLLSTLVYGCAENTPDFILKYTNEYAYANKQKQKQCRTYLSNRIIDVDGVVDYYQYSSSANNDCLLATEDNLQPYQDPNRYTLERKDVVPLTK